MKSKKINAMLGLLTIVLLLLHVGYNAYAYIAFFYDPVLKYVFSIPLIVILCMHAVLGMSLVFLKSEGSSIDIYPRQNRETMLQRVSAALIFPMLLLHIRAFSLLSAGAEMHLTAAVILILLVEVLFYGTVFTHVAVSFSRALITLGWLASDAAKQKADKAAYVFCAFAFAVCIFAITRVRIGMFLG